MADVSISGHLSLPAGNTIVYNQCAAFKGRHKNDGAALKWEVLPARVFLLRLAERKVSLSHPELGHVLSLFCHPVSNTVSLLFHRPLSLLREGMLTRTSAVITHRIGSEIHAQD